MSNADSISWRWLATAVRGRGLQAPDGRPIYQYNLSDAEIVDLKDVLTSAFRTHFDANSGALGAALCFWVAHWYQRLYRGGQHGWKTPLDEVGAVLEHSQIRNLIAGGLSYLQRPIRRINGEHQYLGTVMMEGGFPSRMFTAEAHWLNRYMEAVVLATSQAEPSLDAACGHAEFYQYVVPPTFRAVHFVELVADLSYQIAKLRRRLVEAGITAGAIEWLDKTDPEWRGRLPIKSDEEAEKRLLEGLVQARTRDASMPVGCRRILLRDASGEWRFGVRLQIDGDLRDRDLPPQTKEMLRSYNRARLIASGELARLGYVGIGVASRSGNIDDPDWEIRSLFKSGFIDVRAFPRTQDVVLHIAAGPEILPEFVPSGGARLTSDILVFGAETRSEDAKLVMIGSGSVRDTRPRLFVAMPPESKIDAESGSEVAEAGLVDGLRLISIVGSVVIDVDGDKYRVRSGAETAETASLEAIGETLPNAEASEAIFRGTPSFFVHRGPNRFSGDGSSLRVRVAGAKGSWSPFRPGSALVGAFEIGLFDKDVCLDRMRLVSLPAQAAVASTVPRADVCKMRLSGFGEVSFELLGAPTNARLTRTQESSTIEIENILGNSHRLKVRVRWSNSETVLEFPILTRNIAFYDSNGAALPEKTKSSIPGLLGASVAAVERSSVLIGLRNGPVRVRNVERRVERSLPFSQMRDEVERLFSISDDLDAEVVLEAQWYGKSVSVVGLKRFDFVLSPDRDRSRVFLERSSSESFQLGADAQVEVVGRTFKDIAASDRCLEAIDDGNGRHWIVPDGEGPWIVYAKINGIPRSRPVLVHRNLVGDPPPDELTRALLERSKPTREARLLAELVRVERGEAPRTCDLIASFVGSLDPALPFQSFDILRALPKVLGAAARVAVVCPESVLPRILALEDRMPLTWCLSRPEDWEGAFEEIRVTYRKVFRDVGADERHADEIVADRAKAICLRQPCLGMHIAWMLSTLGISIRPSAPEALKRSAEIVGRERLLMPILKGHLKKVTIEARARNGERTWPTGFSFRHRVRDLTTAEFEMSMLHEQVVDAPCFASEIALGRAERTWEAEESIRMTRSFDPQYFEEAYILAIAIGRGRTTK